MCNFRPSTPRSSRKEIKIDKAKAAFQVNNNNNNNNNNSRLIMLSR